MLSDLLGETSFTPTEQQVLALAVSAENCCGYCMAHSTIARHMVQVPGAIVDALREGRVLDDTRLEALSNYANYLFDTPVDAAFTGETWPPASAA